MLRGSLFPLSRRLLQATPSFRTDSGSGFPLLWRFQVNGFILEEVHFLKASQVASCTYPVTSRSDVTGVIKHESLGDP